MHQYERAWRRRWRVRCLLPGSVRELECHTWAEQVPEFSRVLRSSICLSSHSCPPSSFHSPHLLSLFSPAFICHLLSVLSFLPPLCLLLFISHSSLLLHQHHFTVTFLRVGFLPIEIRRDRRLRSSCLYGHLWMSPAHLCDTHTFLLIHSLRFCSLFCLHCQCAKLFIVSSDWKCNPSFLACFLVLAKALKDLLVCDAM